MRKRVYVTACLYHRHTAKPLSTAHAHEGCIAVAINRLWLRLFDLGGCFITSGVCVCVCVRLCACGYMFIDRVLSLRSFIYAPLYHMSQSFLSLLHQSWSPVCSKTPPARWCFSLSGKPPAGNLSHSCNTRPAVCSVITQKCLRRSSVSPWHTLEEKHLERHSDQLWGRSQEPQTCFPPHVSILGLWKTSRCFQSNHFWSFGEGGVAGAHKTNYIY